MANRNIWVSFVAYFSIFPKRGKIFHFSSKLFVTYATNTKSFQHEYYKNIDTLIYTFVYE